MGVFFLSAFFINVIKSIQYRGGRVPGHLEQKTKVFYAGASERRFAALGQVSGIELDSHEGGDEPNIRSVEKIALGKIDHVLSIVFAGATHEPDFDRTLILAADARTEISQLRGNGGRVIFESKGKPQELNQTQEYFRKMSLAAERSGRGLYRVVASSAAQTVLTAKPERVRSITQTQSAEVYLDPEDIKFLASDEGFEVYQTAFKKFYDTPLYQQDGLHAPKITDLSGGISLPVLLRMNMVERLDDTQISTKYKDKLRVAVRNAILVVAVGFGPQVLDEIHLQAYEEILKWKWLNDVTASALDLDS